MKKFDFKPLLMEKGERIGLYVAGGLSFLLVVMGLLKILGSGSASANAQKLTDKITTIKNNQDKARPKAEHEPGALPDASTLLRGDMLAAADFPAHALFIGPPPKDSMRQNPVIFPPEEFQAEFVRVTSPALELVTKEVGLKQVPVAVYMVKLANAGGMAGAGGVLGAGGMQGGSAPGFTGPRNIQGFGASVGSGRPGGLGAFGNFGAGGAGGAPPPAGVLGAGGGAAVGKRPFLPPGLRVRPGQKATPGQGNKAEEVPIAEAEKGKAGYELATRALPMRMAVVAASFPYKKQVEEFRQKLRYEKVGDVLTNRVKGENDKSWNEFQFRGLIVERAVEEPGKPVTEKDYVAVPIDESARRILLYVYRQVEADDPALKPIKDVSEGLVMGLPKQFPGHTYPDLIGKLETIKTTLAKLSAEDAKKTIVVPSGKLSTEFDPFSSGEGANTTAGAMGAGGGSGMAGVPPGGMAGGAGAAGTPPVAPGGNQGGGYSSSPWVLQGTGPGKDLKDTAIDHCLIRFFDVTLEPGKAYRYRIKVKMANPNYSPTPKERKDTYPQFATDKELESDWVYVPKTVVVPPDSLIYAVDQAAIERTPNWRGAPTPNANEAVVQLQRWIEEYSPDTKSLPRPVGDWVVATRLIIRKGEYVRRLEYKTPIPFKPLESRDLEVDEKSPLEMGDDTILVDFEGGKPTQYERVIGGEPDKPKKEFVNDQAAQELLLMTPEGKLITRASNVDAMDAGRMTRLAEYRKRVEDIRKKDKGGGGGNPIGGNPLGG